MLECVRESAEGAVDGRGAEVFGEEGGREKEMTVAERERGEEREGVGGGGLRLLFAYTCEGGVGECEVREREKERGDEIVDGGDRKKS